METGCYNNTARRSHDPRTRSHDLTINVTLRHIFAVVFWSVLPNWRMWVIWIRTRLNYTLKWPNYCWWQSCYDATLTDIEQAPELIRVKTELPIARADSLKDAFTATQKQLYWPVYGQWHLSKPSLSWLCVPCVQRVTLAHNWRNNNFCCGVSPVDFMSKRPPFARCRCHGRSPCERSSSKYKSSPPKPSAKFPVLCGDAVSLGLLPSPRRDWARIPPCSS